MLCRDLDTAEDLTQSALLHVFEKLVQLRDCHRLLGWTWRVVQNTHRMSIRQSQFAPSVTVEFSEHTRAALATQPAGPFEQLAEHEMQAALFEKIRELPASLKQALELRVFEGKTTAQTAKSLRVSKDAVRTRLARARRALRGSLEEAESSPARNLRSQSCQPDLDAVLRRVAVAHGLQVLAVHHLGQNLADEQGVPTLPRYAIYEFIEPSRACGLNDVDAGFPLVIYRIDLLRSSSGWKIYATCGQAAVAYSLSVDFPDLTHAVENALARLIGEDPT
jgi:RNA polymerase sigma-70 factor (ECF subfamily)